MLNQIVIDLSNRLYIRTYIHLHTHTHTHTMHYTYFSKYSRLVGCFCSRLSHLMVLLWYRRMVNSLKTAKISNCIPTTELSQSEFGHITRPTPNAMQNGDSLQPLKKLLSRLQHEQYADVSFLQRFVSTMKHSTIVIAPSSSKAPIPPASEPNIKRL